jgi:hypothetical protein
MEHDDATSLTAMTEAIDFDHHHDQCQAEAWCDDRWYFNAFVQTDVDEKI